MELEVLIYAAVSIAGAVVGFLLGKAVRSVFRRFFRRVGVDDWFRNFNIGRALLRSGYTAGDFFGSVAAWLIYMLSLLAAAAYFAYSVGNLEIHRELLHIIDTYVFGFVKFFIIAIIGFILVDGFAEYIHKGAFSRDATPVAEYIRVLLYLAVVTFALEQGGINVATLSIMLTPITWGLVAALVALIIVEALKKR